MSLREEKAEGAKTGKLSASTLIAAAVLLLFVGLYFSAALLRYEQYQGQAKAQKLINEITPVVKNDPRFKTISFSVDYDGFAKAKGVVKDINDLHALGRIMRDEDDVPGGGVGLDEHDFVANRKSACPKLLVNIGSVDNSCRQRTADLLDKAGILKKIEPSRLSESSYVYVAVSKREAAIELLKQDPAVVGRYLPKTFQADLMKNGTENLINIGFIPFFYKQSALELFRKNDVGNLLEIGGYPECGIFYLYVSLAKRAQAIQLLRQDPVLNAEYCSI